ncbi:unnamed protein product [Durusdinium trenchii]|uniref:Uncharacterized protein n=1 Tax=Durusdinium trenchii TaxID=1381693 RepID=A0ABP0JZ30_9DINO
MQLKIWPLFIVATLLDSCKSRAWRPRLNRFPRHAVLVDKKPDTREPEPALWNHQINLGGQMKQCELRDASNRDDDMLKEEVAARWAPLRHRCHAWRRKVEDTEGTSSTQIPWSYRICFNSDAVSWAPKPWLQRIDLGWYNASLDEDHANGSLTLHYVNSITRSELAVQCHCGQGPEIISWRGGFNHTLELLLPTCCRLRVEAGESMSVQEIFHWLLAPVARLDLPCLGQKRGRWDYTLCFSGNISQATLSRVPSTSERKAMREVLLGGPADEVPRLVAAEPVVPGQPVETGLGSSDDGNAQWATVPAMLSEALGSKHKALELELSEGQDCLAANGTRKHRTRLRWLCPATWRSFAPDRDGGHTALLAVERPTGCDWVAWIASTLLCTWRPLRPRASVVRQLSCRSEKGQRDVAKPEELIKRFLDQSGAPPPHRRNTRESAVRPAAPKLPAAFEEHTDRSGILYHVGQRVVVLSDGTEGIIIAWDKTPRADLLALRLDDDDMSQSPHFLLAAVRGHFPATGALAHGAVDVPGHVAYIAQEDLVLLSGDFEPGQLPPGFAKYFDESGRPLTWLAKFYPADQWFGGAGGAYPSLAQESAEMPWQDRVQDVLVLPSLPRVVHMSMQDMLVD